MLTTKRYEYLQFAKIGLHPVLSNHRPLDLRKVEHYESDILMNGLLEPLVVWEKNYDEYYLVGGFHRLAAIQGIRKKNPGYFDHVDVRVVSGELDEMRALNLKLNADRLDTKITDYFDTVIHLNNVNWSKEKIAEFLGKSISWIDDLIRHVPIMDSRVRKLLEEGRISWNRAKSICRAVKSAPPGEEEVVLDRELQLLLNKKVESRVQKKPLSFRSVKKSLSLTMEKHPKTTYSVGAEDLFSLIMVLEGKLYDEVHIERVQNSFPGLIR